MSQPKLHHYVPRFHLARFADRNGRLWVFDKRTEKTFQTSPTGIAAERHFYKLPEFNGTDTDPLFLEKQFADIEGQACVITGCWLRQLDCSDKVEIPKINRQIMSDFLALQFFRTADQREILKLVATSSGQYKEEVSADETRSLHARILCKLADGEGVVVDLSQKIRQSMWIFARNNSTTPFCTSDTPVLLKTGDNRIWLKGPGMFRPGVYIVFALTPTIVLYCHDGPDFEKLKRFDNCLSPVSITSDMANHENAGHAGMSARFIFSSQNDFAAAKAFLAYIDSKPPPTIEEMLAEDAPNDP